MTELDNDCRHTVRKVDEEPAGDSDDEGRDT